VSKPDIINQLPNGWTEEIKISKAFRPDGSRSLTRKLVDPTGETREVWHEVLARDGTVLHPPHSKPVRRRPR
jgi:hypothetical protein